MKLRLFNLLSLFFVFAIWAQTVSALQIEKNFLNIQDRQESDLIWNLTEASLVPPIHVRNFNDGSGFRNRDLDVGNGSHGAFDISTYAQFSVNGDLTGNTITLDTQTFSELQLTQFKLDAGWTLRPIGANPLIVKVLGEVLIEGSIDCSGENGEEVSPDTLQINQGGEGVCGGGQGGNGGSETQAPTSGLAGGDNVTGGAAGPSGNPNLGQGGGGGGAYGDTGGGLSPENGTDSLGGVGGLAGVQFTDDAFDVWSAGGTGSGGAGSGGGGGSAHISLTAGDSSGGGGGSGGGVVYIVALGNITIGATGAVLANGGQGGGSASAARAGGGGGGGGGSVMIFSAGEFVNNGSVEAQPGLGGVTAALNSGDGGSGGNGRTWLTDDNLVVTGTGTVSPLSFLLVAGAVRYKLGEFYSISKSYDLYNSYPVFKSVEVGADLIGASEVTVEVSFGKTPNFTPVEWVALSLNGSSLSGSSLSGSGQRYFRYRIGLDNQSSSPPSKVNSIVFDYDPFVQSEFKFAGGCGLVQSLEISILNKAMIVFIFLSPLLVLLLLLKMRLIRMRRKGV